LQAGKTSLKCNRALGAAKNLLRKAALDAYRRVLQDAWSKADLSLGDMVLPQSILGAYSRSHMDGPLAEVGEPYHHLLAISKKCFVQIKPRFETPEAWAYAQAKDATEGLIPLPRYRRIARGRRTHAKGKKEDAKERAAFFEWLVDPDAELSRQDALSKFGIPEPRVGVWAELAMQLAVPFEKALRATLKQLAQDALVRSVSDTAEQKTASPTFVHSEDYRAITINGRQFSLTTNQALVVQTLHEAYEKGLVGVSVTTLLERIGAPSSRLRDSFRAGEGVELWNILILKRGRDMYSLKLSASV
jgi:hypothetical protein